MKKGLYNNVADRWIGPKTSMIYVYSDPHFSDVEMSKVRFPQFTVEEADEYQIKQINAKVGRFNTLIILGDVGNLECVKKLKGFRKILVMGNHDEGNASHYERVVTEIKTFNELTEDEKSKIVANAEQIMKNPSEVEKIEFITHRQKVEDNGLFDEVYEGPLMISDRVILSHEPIEGIPSYLFNIHGHDHKDMRRDKKHYLNVCAEHIQYTPVPLLSLLKEGLVSKVDSIHRETIDKATERKIKGAFYRVNKSQRRR